MTMGCKTENSDDASAHRSWSSGASDRSVTEVLTAHEMHQTLDKRGTSVRGDGTETMQMVAFQISLILHFHIFNSSRHGGGGKSKQVSNPYPNQTTIVPTNSADLIRFSYCIADLPPQSYRMVFQTKLWFPPIAYDYQNSVRHLSLTYLPSSWRVSDAASNHHPIQRIISTSHQMAKQAFSSYKKRRPHPSCLINLAKAQAANNLARLKALDPPSEVPPITPLNDQSSEGTTPAKPTKKKSLQFYGNKRRSVAQKEAWKKVQAARQAQQQQQSLARARVVDDEARISEVCVNNRFHGQMKI
ncbi:hypothetical protein BXZ70DRAFT_908672 [Cristinia sonorae]|uniref:Uncharacterized protein n=1 Tax=Cristinia sonorae TaxID=1940300 RepID=A0A8K0UL45_9AGAR|nr:hypothetical protein BXZ70DRAFT_908672 [Cristinia sonorae]